MTARLLHVAAASIVAVYLIAPSNAPDEECIPVIGQPAPAPFCRPASAPSPSPAPPTAPVPVPSQLPDDGVNGPEQGGFVKPDETNTGVPDGVTLVPLTPQNVLPGDVIEGDTLTINTPDAVYEGFNIPYRIRNRAHGTVIRNSYVRGGPAVSSDTALVSNEGVQSNGVMPLLYMERSTLIPDNPSAHLDGVRGSYVALRGLDISQVADGVHVHGGVDDPNAGHVLMVGNWIHDLIDLPDPDQPDGRVHADGTQVVGSSRMLVFGNNFDLDSKANAALMIKPDRSSIADVMVVANWLRGGGCTINTAPADGEFPQPFQMYSLNQFKENSTKNKNCAIVIPEEIEATTLIRGNSWSNGSLPPPNKIPASGAVGLYWDGDQWIFDPSRAMQEGTWDQARAEALQRAGQFIGVDLAELGAKFGTVAPPTQPSG